MNKQQLPHLEITYRPLHSLILSASNPRKHTALQIKQIAKSIESFGFNVPVLIDGQNQLLCGHGRVQAAGKIGWTEIPTIRVDHLTEPQKRAFMIADNRLTENSSWDDQLLAQSLKDLTDLDLDFSLEDTGFTMGEIDLRIEGLALHTQSDSDPDDDLIVASTGEAVCQPGDLWILGRHKVFCGSAIEAGSYQALMGNEKATMIFTDPPYNVPIQGNVGGLGAIQHREFAMASGEMSKPEFTQFLQQSCNLMASHSEEGSLHYICMDWRHMGELLTAGESSYTGLKNMCVWAKTNAGMGSLYRSQHELVFVFKHGHDSHRNNVALGKYGRNRTNVWNYPSVSAFGRVTEEGNLLALHPTVKPVAMVADAIMDCSARGDLVLDPYLGSGTTLIAAERTGRRCNGIELDPRYVDTIIRRWQAYSGETAVLEATEETFDTLDTEGRVVQ